MSSNFVPLASLFFSQVVAHNTREDGSLKDPNLLRRMENPICRKCHEDYRHKYPEQPFQIKCEGIYDERDYQEKQDQYRLENPADPDVPSLEFIREIYDASYWSARYMTVKDDTGTLIPFVARWYQNEALRCTASHTVDRWGRGMGKTITGIAKELHKALTRQNYPILVICPAQSQSQKWFDEILEQISNSSDLTEALAGKRKQPFHEFRFHNGSRIAIFTAGSKSGRGADSVRGQDPRRVRIDEQDYLVEKDYQAIMPLVRRFSNSEFAGSSTPTGLRQLYWEMCTRNPQYREFFFPATLHPDWSEERRLSCMKEAKTMDRYLHEFMAEFGDPSAGVFKSLFIDRAKKTYAYEQCLPRVGAKYFCGIDWNGKGTGTRIRVIEFDPISKRRRIVARETIDSPDSTTMDSLQAVVRLNRHWRFEDIYIDYGFGAAQDEMLRKIGADSRPSDPHHLADRQLIHVKTVDFGARLSFNKLVPKRDAGSKYLPEGEDETERPTKPFMVEGVVMCFEQDLVEFSNEDLLLDEQLRGYRVKNWSNHGHANTYECGDLGDHDLDAFMLAMMACEMRYGLYQSNDSIQRLVQMARVPGWGVPATSPTSNALIDTAYDARRQRAGIPNRSEPSGDKSTYRITHLMRNGAWVVPTGRSSESSRAPGTVPSRTAAFRAKPGSASPWGPKRAGF